MGNKKSYFMFSKQQMDVKIKTEKGLGNRYIPGTVMVKGKSRVYTEIREDRNSKFKDAIIIAEGDIDKMIYTKDSVD